MTGEHAWTGWPGARCTACGAEDRVEVCIAIHPEAWSGLETPENPMGLVEHCANGPCPGRAAVGARGEAVRAEWERLCEQFAMREELFDRMVRRHRLELDMARGDMVQAGAERDRFRKAHPEVETP